MWFGNDFEDDFGDDLGWFGDFGDVLGRWIGRLFLMIRGDLGGDFWWMILGWFWDTMLMWFWKEWFLGMMIWGLFGVWFVWWFWNDFGMILGWCWGFLGYDLFDDLGCFWIILGLFSEWFWDGSACDFWMIWEWFWIWFADRFGMILGSDGWAWFFISISWWFLWLIWNDFGWFCRLFWEWFWRWFLGWVGDDLRTTGFTDDFLREIGVAIWNDFGSSNVGDYLGDAFVCHFGHDHFVMILMWFGYDFGMTLVMIWGPKFWE